MCLYFELEDHPTSNMEYTPSLEIIKKVNMLFLLSRIWRSLKGMSGVRINAKNKLILGVREEIEKLELSVVSNDLLKSLIASAKGCRIPINPTILGPFRI